MQKTLVPLHQDQAHHTAAQSLQAIESVLKAAFGCITYLRGLLPSDNFVEGHLTSSNSQPTPYNSCSASIERNVSSFKIRIVTRGFTEEADKLLNYLEHGIFDAIQKQYLKSFIFAIYLDEKDPNNIVEAYTFHFIYPKLAGSDTTVPVMTLGADLCDLSLSDNPRDRPFFGATAKEGRPPTIGEVKKAVKGLVKALLTATTAMEQLPARRFATFKLFYYDHTPEDYEPPHFRPGDAEKDRFFFSTHKRSEIPEKCSVGTVLTAHHGMDVHISSVTSFLPSVEDNTAVYAGLTAQSRPLDGANENLLQQIETQENDARERPVVWDAEKEATWSAEDAEGEYDSEAKGVHGFCPLGVRTEHGDIVPLPTAEQPLDSQAMDVDDEIHFSGATEQVPKHVADLLVHRIEDGEQTQRIESTQSYLPTQSVDRSQASLPDADTQMIENKIHALTSRHKFPSESQATSMDILDLETQNISTCGHSTAIDPTKSPKSQFLSKISKAKGEAADRSSVECDCGVAVRDSVIKSDHECNDYFVKREDGDCCLCEGGCGRWYHLWCMGYQSDQDSKLPSKFICFDCRLRNDINFEVIAPTYPVILAAFQGLALLRRAIKLAETRLPATQTSFQKEIGCEGTTAAQLCKRLEDEGFIAMEVTERDISGLLESQTRLTRSKNKTKTSKPRKNLQKAKYVFLHISKGSQLYQDYFNPTPLVERRLLGMDDIMLARGRHLSYPPKATALDNSRRFGEEIMNRREPARESDNTEGRMEVVEMCVESQTQDETQLAPLSTSKRKTMASAECNPRSKKVKISLGIPVDLAE